jgi:hypothetical protein
LPSQLHRYEGVVAPVPPTDKARLARLLPLVFVALVVIAALGGYASTRSTPKPTASAAPLVPLAGRTLYFARFDDFPSEVVDSLVEYNRTKYGVAARVLPLAALDPAAWDQQRQQVVAEAAIQSIKALHGDVARDPGAVIIGLVTPDLYLRGRTDWAWAFGLREGGRFAVVSTARMSWPGGAAGEQQLTARLRKMVSRYIGIMYFGLPPNGDPRSVLYRDVLGVEDLDRMGEDF